MLVSSPCGICMIDKKLMNKHDICNLGQNKMEQLFPIPPQSNDEGAKEQKRAILASLKWREGWSRCSIFFVQDCGS